MSPQAASVSLRLASWVLLAGLLCFLPALAWAQRVTFINPGKSDEAFWVSATRAMEAAARDLGVELEVRYADRQFPRALDLAREIAARPEEQRPHYVIVVNEGAAGPELLRILADKTQVFMAYSGITQPADVAAAGAPRQKFAQWVGSLEPKASEAGLANRRAFDDRSVAEWNRCRRTATPLSALMIDVDHFKLYNDSYGHGQGDECLRSVARALNSRVQRTSDLLARYGGEEFVVLLPDTDQSAALAVGERLREAVAQLHMEHRASKVTDHVTISVGVATAVPSAEGLLVSLLEQADGMLYACKSAGRNCVRGAQAPVPASPS